MNILILNWRDTGHPASGGAEIVTMEHAKRWVVDGHQVTWFTSWYPGSKHEEIVDGVRMIRRAGSLTVYPAGMWYVLLHGSHYDVIVDEVHGFPFFSPLITKTPVVVFIHEVGGIIWDFMYSFPINVIGKFVERWYFMFYKHCLFWTDAASTVDELVAHGIPRDQCTAIPCPITISINQFQITDSELKKTIRNASAPRSLGEVGQSAIKQSVKKEKYPTYIFVSRVVKMKGIEEVIKAFSFIAKEQKKARLWIVGGGEDSYIQTLKFMITEYSVEKNVHFWGRVSEKTKLELMAKAHLLLHASVKEGWGLVVLEAAQVGTPSVVYNVGGLKDVVKNGKTGVVIASNSPREMAREAVRLVSDGKRYRLYQTNGRAWVESLKWDDVAEKSLHLLLTSVKSHT